VPRALAAASQRLLRTSAVAEPASEAQTAAPVDFSLIELPTSDESDTLLRIRHTARPRSRARATPAPPRRDSCTLPLRDTHAQLAARAQA
jgi:hypothetical protein